MIDVQRRRSARAWQVRRLGDLLSGLSRLLRGGHTFHSALIRVAADPALAGPELQQVAARVESGAPIRAEVDRWAAGLAHRDADLVRAVLGTGLAAGSALADALDRAAASLEERADLRRDIASLTAQARASALLLTVAPIAFLLLMAVIDPAVVSSTLATTRGRVAIALGVVLDLAGWAWMTRLARAVAR